MEREQVIFIRGGNTVKFIDDLAGAIQDIIGWGIKGFSYFLAGMVIVGLPLWLLAKLFEWISLTFY